MQWLQARRPKFAASSTPSTIYEQYTEVWERRQGGMLRQARNWRWVAVGSLLLNGYLSYSLHDVAMRTTIHPYVIEVSEAGMVRAVGKVDKEPYEPNIRAVTRDLRLFIEYVRSLPSDPVVFQRNWKRAWLHLTGTGQKILKAYGEENRPWDMLGKVFVSVEVLSVLPNTPESPRSYRVEWQETLYDARNPADKITTRYDGNFFLLMQDYDSLKKSVDGNTLEDLMQENPLGVFIHTFTWTKKNV